MAEPQITELELAYLAGILDGEGCFTIERTKAKLPRHSLRHCVTVGIEMTDKEPLLLLQRYFGGSIYLRTRASSGNWP